MLGEKQQKLWRRTGAITLTGRMGNVSKPTLKICVKALRNDLSVFGAQIPKSPAHLWRVISIPMLQRVDREHIFAVNQPA